MNTGQAISRRRLRQILIPLSGLLFLLLFFPATLSAISSSTSGASHNLLPVGPINSDFQQIPDGSHVIRLASSSRAMARLIEVPNLVGLCREEAKTTLEELGLNPVFSTNQRGEVVNQSYAVGERLRPGQAVALSITPILRRSLWLQVSQGTVQVGQQAHFNAVIEPPWPFGVVTYRLRLGRDVVANSPDGRFLQRQREPGTYSYTAEAVLRQGPCGELPDIPSAVSRPVNLVVLPMPVQPPPGPYPGGSGPVPEPQPWAYLVIGILGLLVLIVLIRLFRRKKPPAESRESPVHGETLHIRLDDGLDAMNSGLEQTGDAMDTVLSLDAGMLEMQPGEPRIRLVEMSDES